MLGSPARGRGGGGVTVMGPNSMFRLPPKRPNGMLHEFRESPLPQLEQIYTMSGKAEQKVSPAPDPHYAFEASRYKKCYILYIYIYVYMNICVHIEVMLDEAVKTSVSTIVPHPERRRGRKFRSFRSVEETFVCSSVGKREKKIPNPGTTKLFNTQLKLTRTKPMPAKLSQT